jgi:hypothetical protein
MPVRVPDSQWKPFRSIKREALFRLRQQWINRAHAITIGFALGMGLIEEGDVDELC